MKRITRREFGAYSLFFAALFGAGAYIAPKLYSKRVPLRPPGALEEKEFLATCIKCGQCVQVCPYHSVLMFDITSLNSVGTPYIEANERGCYLCDLFPCVLACPTGSLVHETTLPGDVKMGVAYLKSPENCLSMRDEKVSAKSVESILKHSNKNEREESVLMAIERYVGKDCTICADMCPYPNSNRAIMMGEDEVGRKIPHIYEECVGCGVCAELCPTNAIEIIARKNYEEIYR